MNVTLERLEPFFKRKSARQRVILFLLAEGYSVGEIVRLSARELKAIDLPDGLIIYRDELLDQLEDLKGPAFLYPGGRVMSHTDIYRILRQASTMVYERPMSVQQFQDAMKPRGKRSRVESPARA